VQTDKVLLFLCLTASPLFAAKPDLTLTPPRFDQLSRGEFNGMLMKGLSQPFLEASTRPTTCSIPLLIYPSNHTDRFTMPRWPARSSDRMGIRPPVPACPGEQGAKR